MNLSIFLTGFVMGLSLIVAIGAQNAFVLRQGLRGKHVFWVSMTCAVSDAVLIAIGVTSFATIAEWLPWVDPVMRYGGAIFLAWYGLKSMRAAFMSTEALVTASTQDDTGLWPAVLTCLALTWLNPHVYLDTVVLLGTISTQFEGQKASFAAGAMSASVIFFFALGYGAAYLRGMFANPRSWRILEAGVAVVMWAIAIKLVLGA